MLATIAWTPQTGLGMLKMSTLRAATQYVLEGMLVYPNKMDFPVMENFGVSPPPLGMLEITIDRAEGLINSDFLSKSDPYCEVPLGPGLCLLVMYRTPWHEFLRRMQGVPCMGASLLVVSMAPTQS